MAKKLVLPRVHVMVLCDAIEPGTDDENVLNLLGVRTQIVADGFPYAHEDINVYLQMTGHAGRSECRIAIADADSDEEIATTEAQEITLNGPLVVVPFRFTLEDCVFPAPGLYYVQAYCDRKLLCERILLLTLG
jgi:hypothetical protein